MELVAEEWCVCRGMVFDDSPGIPTVEEMPSVPVNVQRGKTTREVALSQTMYRVLVQSVYI